MRGAPGYDPVLTVLAFAGERLVGVSVNFAADDGIGWVGDLAVVPEHRRRGIASALLVRSFAALTASGHHDVRLGVVDACSGLKMLMTFAAFSVGAVLLMNRSRFEKFMVVLGIVPIAIACNVLRITVTGMGHVVFTDAKLLEFLHDFYGWLMMPVGLLLLALELWVLRRLVVDPGDRTRPEAEVPRGLRAAAA